MRNRILFALGGVVFGVVASAPVQDTFKLSPSVSIACCAIGGLMLGVFASILVDVFSVKPEQPEEHLEP